tara:strand:+ start:334 stop:876 length:543 start_codon:yes stop_codon:yes gene_type:complete
MPPNDDTTTVDDPQGLLSETGSESEIPDTDKTAEDIAGMVQLEEKQRVDKAVTNVPDKFEFGGRTIELASASIRQHAAVRNVVLEIQKKVASPYIHDQEDEPVEYYEELQERNVEVWELVGDAMHMILNAGSENGEVIPREEVDDLPIGEGAVGMEMISAWLERNNPAPFLGNLLMTRGF